MNKLKQPYQGQRSNKIRQIIVIFAFFYSVLASKHQAKTCQKILEFIKSRNNAKIQKEAEQLEQHKHYPCVLQLYPRYFWAQNMSHIFVKFQFLNSGDTSACERVLFTKKQAEHNKFALTLVCLQSSLLIRYRISVTTEMPLNFYHAVWKQANQNTIILECLKSPNPYFWKKLYLAQQEPIRKPRIWWKMVQKYMDDTKKFIYDLQVQEEQFDVSSYVKKKTKSRKTKQAKQFEPFSKRYFYCNQNNPFQLGSWIN